jgi:hypothetical protein
MIRSFSSGKKALDFAADAHDLARTAVEGFDTLDFHPSLTAWAMREVSTRSPLR